MATCKNCGASVGCSCQLKGGLCPNCANKPNQNANSETK